MFYIFIWCRFGIVKQSVTGWKRWVAIGKEATLWHKSNRKDDRNVEHCVKSFEKYVQTHTHAWLGCVHFTQKRNMNILWNLFSLEHAHGVFLTSCQHIFIELMYCRMYKIMWKKKKYSKLEMMCVRLCRKHHTYSISLALFSPTSISVTSVTHPMVCVCVEA